VDGFVLLSPLVVLAVIALLGFTGCHSLFNLDEVDPPPPPPPEPSTFRIEARVPAAFTVTLVRLLWNRPETPTLNESTITPDVTPEGNLVVFSTTVPDVTDGMWRVSCRVRAREGAAEQEDARPLDFMVVATPGPIGRVLFATTGSPIGGDFKVVPLMFEPA
jgi:hypothetical protein